MKYSKSNKNQPWYIAIVVVIAAVVLAFGKSLMNSFSGGFAMLSAKKNADKVKADLNPQSSDAVRYTFVTGVVDAIKKNIESWNQDEAAIVEQLNSLANAEEVIYASTYYRTANGKSLKAEVEDALDSGANALGWFRKTHFSDLKDYVKKNLV